MGADQHIDWRAAAVSALDWWQEAGVDTLVDEAPRDWLAAPVRPAATRAASPDAIPETLDAFLSWRAGENAPEAHWRGPAFVGEGDRASDLMILIDQPERDDIAGEPLMGGAAGRLFDRMLAAIGRTRATVWLAPMAVRRPPAGRVPPETAARLADLAARHVALVAPRRLLLMGDTPSRALLATECVRARGGLRGINHAGGKRATEAVASFHPRFLIDRPQMKAEAWKDLQLLTGGLAK